MSNTELSLAEQLSALMDGELPEEQARFLRRRLEHDAELRAAWSRLQLASSCLKGHRVRAMALDCAAIHAGTQAAPAAARRPWLRYAAVASMAALAVALAPRLVGDGAGDLPAPVVAQAAAPTAPAIAPSPASADLVAVDAVTTTPAAVAAPTATSRAESLVPTAVVAANEVEAPSSPLPVDAQSPTDFPLVDTGQKQWPRSGLPGAGGDPQLEAYLVRHNQMLANDGLGGFVPYLDVVARDPARSAAEALPATEPATK